MRDWCRTARASPRDLTPGDRIRHGRGKGVQGTFFGRPNTYLFIGDYKYWFMTQWDAIDLDDGQNYVLNRAPLYRDRRDFVIQTGDTGKREDYPDKPAASSVS